MKHKIINKYIERVKIDYPEDDKLHIDLEMFFNEMLKNEEESIHVICKLLCRKALALEMDALLDADVNKKGIILNKLKTAEALRHSANFLTKTSIKP